MVLDHDQRASMMTRIGQIIVAKRPSSYEELLRLMDAEETPELRKVAAELRKHFAAEFAPGAEPWDQGEKWRRLRRIADLLKASNDNDLRYAGASISSALLARGM